MTDNSAQFSCVIYHPCTGSTRVRPVTMTAAQQKQITSKNEP